MRRIRPHTTRNALPPVLVMAGALAACTDAPVRVQVRVVVQDRPAPGLEVTAFPYDPARLLDSLAEAHTVPRPDFDSLERALRAFTPAPPAPADSTDLAIRATRDSVAALADSLRAVGRRAPGYAAAYQRFRRLYGRLVQRSAAPDAGGQGNRDALRALALRAGRAADSLRAWEDAAYAGFDSAAAAAIRAAGREPVAGVTDPEGWIDLALPPGRWTLTAALPHPENPFLEYRWDVPVTVSVFPFRVPLTHRLARAVWRH